jgi:hypothetical protein
MSAMLFCAPPRRRRGAQIAPIKGVVQADGTRRQGALQAASKNYKASTTLLKGKLAAAQQLAQVTAQTISTAVDTALEHERQRGKKHTDKGAHFSASNVALMCMDQRVHSINMKGVDAFRRVQPLEKGKVGELPGRTAVQLRLRRAEMAASVLLPGMFRDTTMFRLPFGGSMDTFLTESGWALEHGVLPSADGSFDMRNAVPYPFDITADGAQLWENKQGFVAHAMKIVERGHVTKLSGLPGPPPFGPDAWAGVQSTETVWVLAFCAGPDDCDNCMR